MKFAFVAKHRSIWPVSWLCKALDVSTSGFHDWLNRKPAKRTLENETVLDLIRRSFLDSDRTYGARRVWKDVLAEGVFCGLHRIERLMHKNALKARPRRRKMPSDTGPRVIHAIAPNILDRQFHATQPNRKWIADFTYVWTAEGWLYVAAIIDLFSRRVVGWSMSATMTAQLVTDALLMAIWRRGKADALLHHSDQGKVSNEPIAEQWYDVALYTSTVRRESRLLLRSSVLANDQATVCVLEVVFAELRDSEQLSFGQAVCLRILSPCNIS